MARQQSQVKICKNVEKSKLDDFGQLVSENGFFNNFRNSHCLGPFSRCFPAVRAQFPLFFHCFLDILIFLQGCGQNAEQWFCGQSPQKKQSFETFGPTVVLWPKGTKNRIFRNMPRTGQNRQKNKTFRNLAQKRSKRTKKQVFKNLARKGSQRNKEHFFRLCARNGCAVKTHKKTKISEIPPQKGLRSKRAKQTKISELMPQTAQNTGFALELRFRLLFGPNQCFCAFFTRMFELSM